MTGLVTEAGGGAGAQLESRQRATKVLHGETVIIEGTTSGIVLIFPGPHTEGYLPGDSRLPITFDDSSTVDAVPLPIADPYLEPML